MLVVAAGLVTACGDSKEPAKAGARPTTAADATDPAMIELVKRTTAATTIGSSLAPVEVRFEYGAAPTPGQPVAIELAVLPQAAVPTLRVELVAPAELKIVDPAGPVTFDKVQAGTIETVRVQAVAERTGTTTLRAIVTLEQPTGQERRVFELPVVVPPPGAAAPAAKSPPGKASAG